MEVVERILEKTVSYNRDKPHADNDLVQVYWHGGEPLLAGIDFFGEVVALESRFQEVQFENRIQTNGTLMTNELAEFFSLNDFQVGFSLDGPEDLHNLNRRFRNSGNGSFADTMSGIERYRRYALVDRIPIIAVITRASLARVGNIYDFFKELGARVQLDIYDIRCIDFLLSNTDRSSIFEMAPSPEEVGRFLIELFDLWFYDESRNVDFSELRHEVKMILQPEIDRGDPFHKKRCDFRRTIFAPDGKVFCCDQYVNDEQTSLGDIRESSLKEIVESKERMWEEIKRYIRKSGEQMACSDCEWGRQCGGGCMSCMKYNSLLLRAREEGLEDERWYDVELKSPLKEVSGETYYCDGLRTFRQHVKQAVEQELRDV
jgi:uncharacterized protein